MSRWHQTSPLCLIFNLSAGTRSSNHDDDNDYDDDDDDNHYHYDNHDHGGTMIHSWASL